MICLTTPKSATHKKRMNKLISACIMLYFCTINTEAHTNDNFSQSITIPNIHQLPSTRISIMFQDREGYMWYGTKDDGLCRDDGYNIEVFRADFIHPELNMNNWITSIAEDNKSRLWIGTKRGLYILDKQDYSIHPTKNKELQTWAFDYIYNSTDNNIVAIANNHRLTYNSKGECIKREKTTTTAKRWEQTTDKRGRIWKLTAEGLPVIMSYPKFKTKKKDSNDLHNIESIPSPLPEGLKIHSIKKDSTGNLWLGTNKSLWKYSKNKIWQQIDSNIGVINSLTISNDGTIFLGTEHHGLISYKNGKLTSLTPDADKVMSMSITGDSILWMSTLNGRLLAYDITPDSSNTNKKTSKNRLTDHSEKCGLSGNAIVSIVTDKKGRVWILTNQCLTVYSPDMKTVHYFHPTDMNPQPIQFIMLYADIKGNIYMENDKGLFSVNLNSKYNYEMPSHTKVILSCYQTNGERHFQTNDRHSICLSPDEDDIHLYFTTFDHLNARKIRFAFRYQGEKEWHCMEKGRNDIYLTQLSRGNHNIEIKATNENGIWSSMPLTLTIYRTPHWWETTLAFITYFLILSGTVFLQLYRFYQRQKQNIIERQMRTSAEDIQTVLQETVTAEDAFIQKVIEIIESNLQNSDFNVEELSRQLAMERTGFYRKLTASIGKTPTDFIRSVRLRRAKDLLGQGHSISEVSNLVGFSTPSYFSNCFLKEYGMRPSEYVTSINNDSGKCS